MLIIKKETFTWYLEDTRTVAYTTWPMANRNTELNNPLICLRHYDQFITDQWVKRSPDCYCIVKLVTTQTAYTSEVREVWKGERRWEAPGPSEEVNINTDTLL